MDKWMVELTTVKRILVIADDISEATDVAFRNKYQTYGQTDYTITRMDEDTTLAALDDVDLVVKLDE